MKKFALAVILLALCSLSYAQSPGGANPNEAAALLAQKNAAENASHSQFSPAECSFTFASSTGHTFLKYCVTVNGNITSFESPQSHEQLNAGFAGEGYGLCDFTPGTASYNDYGGFGDSGNFGPASVVNQNANLVKIARTTSDDIWTLTQTISQVAGVFPAAKIVMTLTNNSAIVRRGNLLRYADVDSAGLFQNSFDATDNSAFGWNPALQGNGSGLMLQDIGNSAFHFAYTQTLASGPAPCDPFANISFTTQSAVDGSVVIVYRFMIPAHKSLTVTVGYRPM
jgi:hypothetical protein